MAEFPSFLWYSIVCVYICFLHHSFLDRHFGCFHILAIVNNAAVKHRGWKYLFQLVFSFPSDKYLNHMIVVLFFFEEPPLFSIVAAPTYMPINSAQEFPFLHVLANTCVFFFFIVAILTDVKWYFIMALICISLISDVECFLMYMLAVRLLWQNVPLDSLTSFQLDCL